MDPQQSPLCPWCVGSGALATGIISRAWNSKSGALMLTRYCPGAMDESNPFGKLILSL